MTHAPEFLWVVERMAPVIRRVETYAHMSDSEIADWLAYFWNRGTMSFVTGKGIGVIKIFRQLPGFLEDYIHEPDGRFIEVELFSADSKATIKTIWHDLAFRWGPRDIVLWDRGFKSGLAPRMYAWPQLTRFMEKLTYVHS